MSTIKLPIIIKKDTNNTYFAYCPIFKGCHTFSDNEDGLKSNIEEVTSMYFDMYKDGEDDIFAGDKTLFLNFDDNGKITSNFSKEFTKDSYKVLS